MSELPATIRILERPYKMRINADDEHYLRQAAALIDSQAKNYSKKYACTDRQDLLAMVALTHITQLLKLQTTHRFEDTQLEDRLTEINRLLDSVDGQKTESMSLGS